MERYSFSGEDLINLDISVWRKKLDKAENRRKKKNQGAVAITNKGSSSKGILHDE